MSTTTRLLALLELLQTYETITGAEIAQQLDVDGRSVRRYIKQLQEMGIPVEGERGRHGAYRLDRGYKLPPMMFTEEEVVALTLGLMTIRAFQFPVEMTSIAGALAKVQRIMPQHLLERTMTLQETLHFNYSGPPTSVDRAVMIALSNAMQHQHRLQLTYQNWQDSLTERAFDAYGIVFHEGYWYVAGYCHLRQDLRTLRVDRIQHIDAMTKRFVRPSDFDALAHVMTALSQPSGVARIKVLFMTTLAEAERSLPARYGTLTETADGILFERPAYRMEWVAPLLLSVDFPIRVLQPAALEDMIRQLGQRAMQIVG